eukprot:1143792-Pelagomonas_calceolata.AAC.4
MPPLPKPSVTLLLSSPYVQGSAKSAIHHIFLCFIALYHNGAIYECPLYSAIGKHRSLLIFPFAEPTPPSAAPAAARPQGQCSSPAASAGTSAEHALQQPGSQPAGGVWERVCRSAALPVAARAAKTVSSCKNTVWCRNSVVQEQAVLLHGLDTVQPTTPPETDKESAPQVHPLEAAASTVATPPRTLLRTSRPLVMSRQEKGTRYTAELDCRVEGNWALRLLSSTRNFNNPDQWSADAAIGEWSSNPCLHAYQVSVERVKH